MTPPAAYLVFGRGRRQKWFYRAGRLAPLPGRAGGAGPPCAWDVVGERIDRGATVVTLDTRAGSRIEIGEDATGLWWETNGDRHWLETAPAPDPPEFTGHPHRAWLRPLWHETMVCLVGGEPLPNPVVYRRAWYRDAALVAMVLEATGHLGEIEAWIDRRREPYDRNNSGHREPDNLGQLLFLVSRVRDRRHPLVATVIAEANVHRAAGHLTGLTDYAQHPVYQTQWLKFGLRALGLDDSGWRAPDGLSDDYAALCWWDRDGLTPPARSFDATARARYPYLGWAEDHFHRRPPPWELLGPATPLTWEAHASEADYAAQDALDPTLAAQRQCRPHSWHAAEAFLHLLADGA